MIPAQLTNADNHCPLCLVNPSGTELSILSATRLTTSPVGHGITAIDAR